MFGCCVTARRLLCTGKALVAHLSDHRAGPTHRYVCNSQAKHGTSRPLITPMFVPATDSDPPALAVLDMLSSPPHSYYEVRLGRGSETLVRNSILLLPQLLTDQECDLLMGAAEECVAGTCTVPGALERVRVCLLGVDAWRLSTAVLLERVLGFLEKEMPQVAQALFGYSSNLGNMSLSFSFEEPTVNRYEAGGNFEEHTDGHALTVNILLSSPASFRGGGTLFFTEGEVRQSASVWLQPAQGMGVIFNGKVRHSGRPVESGIRHLYVASFDLEPLDAPEEPDMPARGT